MNAYKQFVHQWSWVILVAFCVIGLIFPVIGAAALICMVAPVMMAFFKGRKWCGVFCPRGSFLDVVLGKMAHKGRIPSLLKQTWFRILFLGLLMGAFAVQFVLAWGDWLTIGQVFVRMILLTTLAAILLGVLYNQRAWCLICPMGTMAHWVSGTPAVKNNIPHIVFQKEKCIDCKLCSKHCPVEIRVHAYHEKGKVLNADCLKCQTCIAKCPKKSLYVA